MLKAILLLLGTLLLAACGGGGSGDSPAASSSSVSSLVNTAPVARAGTAQTVVMGATATFDGSSSSDADGNPLSYAWTVASAPAGSSATLSGATTAKPTLVPDMPGSYTLSLAVSDGLLQSVASVQLTVTAAIAPQIALSGSEPLSGAVQLTLTGTVNGAVTWYVDLGLLGSGGTAPGNVISWNTLVVANGQHLLAARIQTGANAYQEVRRTVTVNNSSVTLSAAVSGTTGTIIVDVQASSINGIASVSGALDGGTAVVLTTLNGCSRFCVGTNDRYRFTVDAAAVHSGSHSMVVVATDKANGSRTLTVDVPVYNRPVITLAGPVDGAFIFGTLTVSGTVASDMPGVVTVAARLSDTQFLSTTQAAFSGSLDLTGVPPGSYTLTITATDSTGLATPLTRTVIVTSSAALAYMPNFTLPAGAQLMWADATRALYTIADGARVRDLNAGTEVTLADVSSIIYPGAWQISDGRTYAQGKGTDCTSSCIYQWDAAGVRQNLSAGIPFSTVAGSGTNYDQYPVAHNGYVLWVNWLGTSVGGYTLYNVSTGTYRQILAPAGVSYVGNTSIDFAVVGGIVNFYYWTQTDNAGSSSAYDIYKWTSDTGVSTPLTAGARNVYVQTDGVRAAWLSSPLGSSADTAASLQTVPLAGGGSTAASTQADGFLLRDGVLVWTESTRNTRTVKASTGVQTTTISLGGVIDTLLANGGGQVIYMEGGKVYSWSSAHGSTLRAETSLMQAFAAGGVMVFALNSSVYRVILQ